MSHVQATEAPRKELTEATQETAKWEGEAHGNVQAAQAALRRAHRALEAQEEVADRSKVAALQLQALNMAVNFESAANQERTKRLKLIDDVRALSLQHVCPLHELGKLSLGPLHDVSKRSS